MSLKTVYLSLGSNLGEREENIERALEALEREHVRVITRSSLYETAPRDVPQQPWFLNLAAACETRCFPLQFLALLQRIERELGRVRLGAAVRGPRVIDLDILLFGGLILETRQLVVPHPRMLERRFVLEPLLEIAPGLRHPATKELLSKHLAAVQGQQVLIRPKRPLFP